MDSMQAPAPAAFAKPAPVASSPLVTALIVVAAVLVVLVIVAGIVLFRLLQGLPTPQLVEDKAPTLVRGLSCEMAGVFIKCVCAGGGHRGDGYQQPASFKRAPARFTAVRVCGCTTG